MMASVDGADMTARTALTGDQVSAHIAANALVLADCSGPRGLLHVTGELDALRGWLPHGHADAPLPRSARR